jgi:hypothetical protein
MKLSGLAVALPVPLLSPSSALAPDMCVVASNLAIMGANMTAAFDTRAGQGCMSDIHPHGAHRSSEVSQRAQHGTVTTVTRTLRLRSLLWAIVVVMVLRSQRRDRASTKNQAPPCSPSA